MGSGWSWFLIIAGSILVLIEMALGGFAGFDLVLIGSAVVIGGALGLIVGNPVVGLITAGVLAVAYVLVGRRWVRARMRPRLLHSNIDAVLGSEAMVVQRVGRHEAGQVRVKDEVWRAIAASDAPGPYEPGSVVHVESVDGVTLHVRS